MEGDGDAEALNSEIRQQRKTEGEFIEQVARTCDVEYK